MFDAEPGFPDTFQTLNRGGHGSAQPAPTIARFAQNPRPVDATPAVRDAGSVLRRVRDLLNRADPSTAVGARDLFRARMEYPTTLCASVARGRAPESFGGES